MTLCGPEPPQAKHRSTSAAPCLLPFILSLVSLQFSVSHSHKISRSKSTNQSLQQNVRIPLTFIQHALSDPSSDPYSFSSEAWHHVPVDANIKLPLVSDFHWWIASIKDRGYVAFQGRETRTIDECCVVPGGGCRAQGMGNQGVKT